VLNILYTRGHCPLRDASSLLTEYTIKQSYQYACHLTRLTQRDVTYHRYRKIKWNKTNQNFWPSSYIFVFYCLLNFFDIFGLLLLTDWGSSLVQRHYVESWSQLVRPLGQNLLECNNSYIKIVIWAATNFGFVNGYQNFGRTIFIFRVKHFVRMRLSP